jgi:histidinol-phosphate aminotransferase
MVRRLVKKNVRKLKPYQAEEIPCRIKLDANESPFGFDSALKSVEGLETNRYPDPEAKSLRQLVAKSWGVGRENILHGNGSDELIYYLIAVFGGPVLCPVPTFSMYGIIASILNEKSIAVPLDRNFQLDRMRMLTEIRRRKPHLVFLSSPNNPTGNSFDPEVVTDIIRSSRSIVVVDEAYLPFSAKKSFVKLLGKYPNLVIMKTLSKIGLAALRTGFIVSSREIVEEVNKVRLPFNVNALSQAAAVAALQNSGTIRNAVDVIVRERDALFHRLRDLPGVIAFPSDANFILFRVKDADRVYRMLLRRGILVRNISDSIRGCLRVTIGSPEENEFFFKALKKIVQTA